MAAHMVVVSARQQQQNGERDQRQRNEPPFTTEVRYIAAAGHDLDRQERNGGEQHDAGESEQAQRRSAAAIKRS
jgi:hypothetical protein